MGHQLPWLSPHDDGEPFPDPHQALREPNGLLALGGSLSPRRLLKAYRRGIFPWFSDGQPILWWSPEPRTVLFPEAVRIRRSLKKVLKKQVFTLTMDRQFAAVMAGCAAPRKGEAGTWITAEMTAAYEQLYRLGYAHSVESWQRDDQGELQLVGGLYGVALGQVFFGESMFSLATDSSKAALVALCQQLQRWGFLVIDCQMPTAHLASLGAVSLTRREFMALLDGGCPRGRSLGRWQLDDDLPQSEWRD